MLVLILGVTIIFLVMLWYVRFRTGRRNMYELADKLPGPPPLPFIGHLHRFMGDTEDIMTSMKELSYLALHQGGLSKIWIGPAIGVLLTDPVDIEYVLKTYLEKESHSNGFLKEAVDGLGTLPVPMWRRRRKALAPAFSPRNLTKAMMVFSEQSEMLVRRLQSKVGAGAFDAFPYFTSYTLRSIFETALGIDSSSRSEEINKLTKAIAEVTSILTKRIYYPWLKPGVLFRLSSYYNTYKKRMDFAYTFTDKSICEAQREWKMEESKKTKADHRNGIETLRARPRVSWQPFISFLTSKTGKEGFSDMEVCWDTLTLGLAGTDTSAVSTCFTLLLLGKHQDIQDKIYQELLDVFGKSERPLVKEDLSKLCYLEGVIKESMRLYPPAPFVARQSDTNVTLPSGAVLPAGCAIYISIWGAHRNPAYWGADAELFRPERFSADFVQHPGAYLPFSAGPRNCIGHQYAMMSMKNSLSSILRKYRVRVAAENIDSELLRVKYEIMLKPVNGYNIKLELR